MLHALSPGLKSIESHKNYIWASLYRFIMPNKNPKDRPYTVLSVTMPNDLLVLLDDFAAAIGRTRSRVIAESVEQRLGLKS